MGYRSRSATPGTILSLAATILLAIVSFNTPLLKSLYFLDATFSSGTYDGELKLGTLGYCLTYQGSTSCVGPQVGYEFDPNTLFNVSVFNIPEAVTKYLTYTLFLHIVALAFAAGATVFGLLSHISTMSLLCFPTCTASIAGSFALIAFIFDIAIFYIAKSRIDSVSGASASVGISVWLTLAAWLLLGFSGCAYSIGRCCVGARRDQESGDPRRDPYNYSTKNGYNRSDGPDEMRLLAIRDEQLRKKEQGLPSFQELERVPLTDPGEDKYLYEDMPGALPNGSGSGSTLGVAGGAGANGLRRDGSVLQGVGVGYGRKVAKSPASDLGHGVPGAWPQNGGYQGYRGYDNESVSAGNAGVGAGPGGVDVVQPQHQGYDAYGNPAQYGHDQYGEQNQYADRDGYGADPNQNYYQGNNGYNDPYSNPQPAAYPDPYGTHHGPTYPPQAAGLTIPTPNPAPAPTPAPQAHLGPHDYYSGPSGSSESGYDPGPSVHHASNDLSGYNGVNGAGGNRVSDAYDAYDDGLGAIGRAATSPTTPNGSAGGGGGYYPSTTNGYYAQHQQDASRGGTGGLHVPTPQHLVGQGHSALLRSPVDGQGGFGGGPGVGGGREGEMDDAGSGRPPSYGAVAGNSGYVPPPEKR